MDNKAPDAFRTISEVADDLDLPQHVLRFWESRFREIRPMKRGGGRRYYRPTDIELLRGIRHLLYGEGYTIRGVQRILREHGSKFVEEVWREGAPQPPHGAAETGYDGDDAEDVVQPAEEKRGLLGRLIGRDVGDGEDDAPGRAEPPLQSAPTPRVEPTDRALPVSEEVELPPVRPAVQPRSGLSKDDLHKLHAALHELRECRNLIDLSGSRSS